MQHRCALVTLASVQWHSSCYISTMAVLMLHRCSGTPHVALVQWQSSCCISTMALLMHIPSLPAQAPCLMWLRHCEVHLFCATSKNPDNSILQRLLQAHCRYSRGCNNACPFACAVGLPSQGLIVVPALLASSKATIFLPTTKRRDTFLAQFVADHCQPVSQLPQHTMPDNCIA